MIDYLPGEKLIASMDADQIVLTSMRLKVFSPGSVLAVRLNQISSIAYQERLNHLILLIPFIGILISIAAKGEPRLFAWLAIPIGLALYVKYKKKYLVIKATGGPILYDVEYVPKKDIARFMHLVERAMGEYRG